MDELINKNWSWKTALENYKEDLIDSRQHADTSIRVRMDLLRRIMLFAERNKISAPAKTNKTLLKQYFKKRKLAASTQIVQKRYLVHFFSYLEKNYVILDNIAELIPTPKMNTKERIIPTEKEIEAIYRAILSQEKEELVARDLVIVDLLILPALRVSELVSLKIKNVSFDTEKILVTRKGGDQQKLPIQKETLGHIEEMLESRNDYSPDDYLLRNSKKRNGKYGFMSIRSVQKLVQKYLLTNVTLDKLSYGPHLLRHFGGTMMARDKVDLKTIQKIFNHKNIETTMIYQHTDEETMTKAVQGARNFSNKSKKNK